MHSETRAAAGVLTSWDESDGSGTISSDETPGGCLVLFTDIDRADRPLHVGSSVYFTYESAVQQGHTFRAIRVTRTAEALAKEQEHLPVIPFESELVLPHAEHIIDRDPTKQPPG